MDRVPPAYAHLAASWNPGTTPDRTLVEDTRSALLAVRPPDLAGVAQLVGRLDACLASPEAREPARRALFALLDAARRRAFTEAMGPADVDPWTGLLVPVIERADHTFGAMLRSREETDPRVLAMRVLGSDGADLTVADLARRTRAIARGLLALAPEESDPRVAILSENSLETALTDIACLSNGIVDFPLPGNSTPEQVAYMLRHSGAHILVVSDEEQVDKVLPSLPGLPDLKEVVVVSRAAADRHGLLSLEQAVAQGAGAFDDAERAARAARVRSRDVATVMYTSGTTGRPKGIVFDHLNLVSKRLCRGFALPHLNEGDVFLAYLPLYHTFGRFLEMTGSLWWGGTYVFARSTGHASLVEDFKTVQPTVFISVPKKWMELQETAQRQAPPDDPEAVAGQLRALTGGRLAHGLSAAGYLDPAVFRTFHRAGVELCSGYGMTEATGGITMTPPGEYVDGSIGKPLPGIECVRAEDGELLIRGAYVSPGYLHAEGEELEAHDAEGWFHTGDLVSIDAEGHFRITGRKKEIYKNRAGQTIAPQRVENLFRDFDDLAQAFLVGDHREYNTLLVWPNFEGRPELRKRTPEELQHVVSSLVASANRFLAPFERVVAFRILDRALDVEHGELTHKLTYKRDVVARNWKTLIDGMYQHRALSLSVDGIGLRIPNWVLRELGVLVEDVVMRGGEVRAGGTSLRVGTDPRAPGSLRVGDLAYHPEGGVLDLGAVLAHPTLWLGNEGLRRFLGEEAFRSLAVRRPKGTGEVRLDPRIWEAPDPERIPALIENVGRDEATVESVHAAGELLRAERPEARRALSLLERVLATGRHELVPLARGLLRRCADSPEEEIRRRAFRSLLPSEEAARTVETLQTFLDRLGPQALRDEDLATFGEKGLSEAQVEELLATLQSPRALDPDQDSSERRLLSGAMRLAAAYSIAHPPWYGRVRIPLARLTFHPDPLLAARASEEYDRNRRGFQHWLGPNLRLAVDPASGEEYTWRDVVRFEGALPPRTVDLLLRSISESTLVRSTVFVLAKGPLLSLADIPPGGATVTLLGRRLGKSVYRFSLTTRGRETFDFAVNHAETMPPAELRDEVLWLLSSGAPPPLVEAFGSYHPDWGIYTEEFIPGENVEQQLARFVVKGEARRLMNQWPFVCWNALAAHVGFWDRTGRRVALRDPSPAAFIVPSHDYQTGARLVSVSDRGAVDRLDDVLDRFETAFVTPTEALHPALRGGLGPTLRFSAVIEALGLERGRTALSSLLPGPRAEAALAFLSADRCHRLHLPPRPFRHRAVPSLAGREPQRHAGGAGHHAGGALDHLPARRRRAGLARHPRPLLPAHRLRRRPRAAGGGARPAHGAGPVAPVPRPRPARAPGQSPGGRSSDAREDYFLARMTFRHLRPGDQTSLISLERGDHLTAEVVVGLTDERGESYSVRAARSPREVARLLQLFRESSLEVSFEPEHRHLIAVDDHDAVIGGVFYRQVTAERTHMEKIVVSRKHRGHGIADGIMRELGRRQRARGVHLLETGWFQPEVLARFGFRVDAASGGMVLDLVAASAVPH